MITTKYVRDHIDEIKASLRKRNSDYPIDELLELDKSWRAAQTELQALQAKRNKAGLEINEVKKEGGNIDEKVAALADVKKSIESLEKKLPEYESRIEVLLYKLPNIMLPEVPEGKSEEQNPEIRKVGKIRNESSKGHEELLAGLGLLDIERAAKVAGARFYYLRGDIVLLEQSLERFALDEMVKNGYMPIEPPFLMKNRYYKGTVPFGTFEEMLYLATSPREAEARADYEKMDENLFLIATAEHPLTAMHAEEVFSGKELPLKYVGISPCFRREAGSHGKDTKGIFRVHQFNKVEQVIFCKPEDSPKYHEELLRNIEGMLAKLELPYRVIEICAGDMSAKDARSFDVEVYLPSQKKYRELMSCSNCTDWQSTRLDIKYDEGNERRFVHTLNATAISMERMIVAIVENYSNPDGTITVPKALVPYMGKEVIGGNRSK
ncbi:MAG: serine--tRNA ligase [Candidatus Marsarchaeota archaeon]|jgi:seryl-tRNA synthetase|nr:serine--tRNA ligase [Candidatus Marsarchaeota archaeon]